MQHYIISVCSPLSGTATTESSWSDVSKLKVTRRLSRRVLLNLGFNTMLTWPPLKSQWIFFSSGSFTTRLSHSGWRERDYLQHSRWWRKTGRAVLRRRQNRSYFKHQHISMTLEIVWFGRSWMRVVFLLLSGTFHLSQGQQMEPPSCHGDPEPITEKAIPIHLPHLKFWIWVFY